MITEGEHRHRVYVKERKPPYLQVVHVAVLPGHYAPPVEPGGRSCSEVPGVVHGGHDVGTKRDGEDDGPEERRNHAVIGAESSNLEASLCLGRYPRRRSSLELLPQDAGQAVPSIRVVAPSMENLVRHSAASTESRVVRSSRSTSRPSRLSAPGAGRGRSGLGSIRRPGDPLADPGNHPAVPRIAGPKEATSGLLRNQLTKKIFGSLEASAAAPISSQCRGSRHVVAAERQHGKGPGGPCPPRLRRCGGLGGHDRAEEQVVGIPGLCDRGGNPPPGDRRRGSPRPARPGSSHSGAMTGHCAAGAVKRALGMGGRGGRGGVRAAGANWSGWPGAVFVIPPTRCRRQVLSRPDSLPSHQILIFCCQLSLRYFLVVEIDAGSRERKAGLGVDQGRRDRTSFQQMSSPMQSPLQPRGWARDRRGWSFAAGQREGARSR